MILDFQSMGFEVFYPIFPVVVIIISLLALFLIWINRKLFIALFKDISRNSLLILILISIVFVLICAFSGLNFKFFNACDSEWRELNAAKNLLSGDRYVFNQIPDRIVSPLILAFGFRIFGSDPLVASLLNLFLAVLSIFLVFILAQIVFKNEKVSLLSSFIYAFTPFTLVFTSLRMGDSTTVGFFLLLFVITAILSFRYHRLSLHILTLIFFALVSQTKLEYFILIFPYIFCFIIFKEYKHLPLKKIVVLIILFFLFSFPFFVSNSHFRKSFVSGWCGHPSQTFYDGEIHSYTLPLTGFLDKIIKFSANARFSINYLIYDIPTFIRFWFSKALIFVSLLIFLGILFAIKKYKKETIFILFLFLSISMVYLADCIFYEERLAIPSFGPIVIFSGFTLSLFLDKITGRIRKKGLVEIFVAVLITLVLLSFWYFDFNRPRKLIPYQNYCTTNIFDDYNHLRDVVNYYKLSPADSYLIPVHHSERDILKFLGYESDCLTDLVKSDYFQDRQKFLDSFILPISETKNNYFIYTWNCETLGETADICNFAKENYVKEKIGEMGGYTIYSLNTKGL